MKYSGYYVANTMKEIGYQYKCHFGILKSFKFFTKSSGTSLVIHLIDFIYLVIITYINQKVDEFINRCV